MYIFSGVCILIAYMLPECNALYLLTDIAYDLQKSVDVFGDLRRVPVEPKETVLICVHISSINLFCVLER